MQNQSGCGGASNSSRRASGLNPSSQMSPLPALQNGHRQISASDPRISQFDPSSPHDNLLEQLLSATITSDSWPPHAELPGAAPPLLDHHLHNSPPSLLASELPRNQIDGAAGFSAAALTLQQLPFLSTEEIACGGDSGLLPLPLNHGGGYSSCDSRILLERSGNDGFVDGASFQSQNPGAEGFIHALYNGFGAETGHESPPPHQNFRAHATAANQFSSNAMGGGAPGQPKQKVRARRGQATDPHSIAERLRRERIAERMKSLQELVPNANRTDKASMLDEIIDYVKFIQLQVKVLSMSRLGGVEAAAAPLADLSSGGGPGGGVHSTGATEQRVAKLMEENMGSAMQYLQGKGLCLMPISLATAISPDSHTVAAAAPGDAALPVPRRPEVEEDA